MWTTCMAACLKRAQITPDFPGWQPESGSGDGRDRPEGRLARGHDMPLAPGVIASRDGGHRIYRLTVRPRVGYSRRQPNHLMNTWKTIFIGLLLAGALLALGFVGSNRRAIVVPQVRCYQSAIVDPAVMFPIARPQAAVGLSQASGAVSPLPCGFY
jgi:hypothetical protein